MSFWEWWGERYNPGPVGGFDPEPPKVVRNRLLSFVCFLLACGLLGAWFYFLGGRCLPGRGGLFALAVLGTLAYLLVGFFFFPRPDWSNMGLLGGLIDRPFRYSDDINRMLFFLQILLWPGRVIMMWLVNPLRLKILQAEQARLKEEAQQGQREVKASLDEFADRYGFPRSGSAEQEQGKDDRTA